MFPFETNLPRGQTVLWYWDRMALVVALVMIVNMHAAPGGMNGVRHMIAETLTQKCSFFRSRCSDDLLICPDRNDFPCAQSLGDGGEPICIPYNLTCDGIEERKKDDSTKRFCISHS
jgi:hypothetical protein